MQARELERLNRRFLIPRLGDGWMAKGTLVVASPIADLLRGLAFEPSGLQRDARRIRYFVMPLYAPVSSLHFSYARVLGGAKDGLGDRWFTFPDGDPEPVMQEIADLVERQALPWLERLHTPADLARLGREIHGNDRNPSVAAEIGYSHILSGDVAAARTELRRAADLVVAADQYPWVAQLGENVDQIRADLEASPERAVRRLGRWREEALGQLGLTSLAADT